jgi:hypothetical protein
MSPAAEDGGSSVALTPAPVSLREAKRRSNPLLNREVASAVVSIHASLALGILDQRLATTWGSTFVIKIA